MDKETKDLKKQEAPTPAGTERTRNRKVYVPKVDIYENKDSIVLVADMPGVDEHTVDVTLEKNVLTITGLSLIHI
ncbi:MAG: Hsp20 family protein [Syntrophales bacterium]|nr:Hsp20 family protein [Syntrophales bacterium]